MKTQKKIKKKSYIKLVVKYRNIKTMPSKLGRDSNCFCYLWWTKHISKILTTAEAEYALTRHFHSQTTIQCLLNNIFFIYVIQCTKLPVSFLTYGQITTFLFICISHTLFTITFYLLLHSVDPCTSQKMPTWHFSSQSVLTTRVISEICLHDQVIIRSLACKGKVFPTFSWRIFQFLMLLIMVIPLEAHLIA